MRRSQIVFAALYASSLQWWSALHTLGRPIDGQFAILVFFALWVVSVKFALALRLTWRAMLFAFLIVYVVDLSVSVATYLADLGAHSRDLPLIFRPIPALIFATIASSGMLLAVGIRGMRRQA